MRFSKEFMKQRMSLVLESSGFSVKCFFEGFFSMFALLFIIALILGNIHLRDIISILIISFILGFIYSVLRFNLKCVGDYIRNRGD